MSNDAGQYDAAAEDHLVQRAKVEAEAFAALYDRYYPRVLTYCVRRLSDRATAEDVTSEVFLSVARRLPTFSGRCGTDFRRWLFRIATNAANAQMRQTLSRQSLLEAAARDGRVQSKMATSGVPQDADWELVREEIHALDERVQTIIALRFFAGLSHDEIASIVDATPGAVRTTLSRGLKTLRERLSTLGLFEAE